MHLEAHLIRTIAAAFSLSIIAACSSVPMGTAQQDGEVKKFAPPVDKAAVYIYRNEFMAPGIRMDVLVNGIDIGSTTAKTFLYTELPPGRHTITSKAENNHSIEIQTKAGESSYVWQEVKLGGWYARSKLQQVDAATGQSGVRECKLTVR